jgi:serine/threonine protein kinase
MATVYEAGHTVLPRRAALKVMHGDLRRQPGMATRVVQEAAIIDAVRHPGVVRVYDCAVLPDRRPWIAMELVEGETLANRLHEVTALPPVEVATLLGDVADVLAAVHKAGVVHRDLKPDNLLCTPTDYDYPIRVLDWGVARMGPIGRLTIDGLTPGTPIYMSPEQATGRDIASPCDVYSLGVIAYEALAGHPPFDGRTLAEVVCMHLTHEAMPLHACCGAPLELSNLVARMLHKRPAARPSAAEVRQAARAIARDLSQAYESFELSFIEADRATAVPSPYIDDPSDLVGAIDANVLEHGVTEMLPVVRRPRWTPEYALCEAPSASVAARGNMRPEKPDGFSRIPSLASEQSRRVTVTPRAQRDQVAGEIDMSDKRR